MFRGEGFCSEVKASLVLRSMNAAISAKEAFVESSFLQVLSVALLVSN